MKTYYHVDMECSIHSTQFRANTTDNPSFQWLNIDSFEQACKVISVNQQCEQVRQMLREAECTAEFELGWTQESRS